MMIIQTISECTLLIVLYMSACFIIAQIKKDNSIVDIAWGLGFVLISWFSFFKSNLFVPRHILVTTLVTLWGLRISGYIFIRNFGKKEDIRYAQMKAKWGKHVKIYSFLVIFMLQGLLILVIGYPIIVINSSLINGLTILDYIGASIWLFGYLFETIGDIQLYLFLKQDKNKGKIMTRGLWKYTRHPNYFGEATLWWGIWLIALSVPYGWSTIISPLTITFFLLYVSGPMAEQQTSKLEGYIQYRKQTNMFIPWFAQRDNT